MELRVIEKEGRKLFQFLIGTVLHVPELDKQIVLPECFNSL